MEHGTGACTCFQSYSRLKTCTKYLAENLILISIDFFYLTNNNGKAECIVSGVNGFTVTGESLLLTIESQR